MEVKKENITSIPGSSVRDLFWGVLSDLFRGLGVSSIWRISIGHERKKLVKNRQFWGFHLRPSRVTQHDGCTQVTMIKPPRGWVFTPSFRKKTWRDHPKSWNIIKNHHKIIKSISNHAKTYAEQKSAMILMYTKSLEVESLSQTCSVPNS